MSFGVLINKQFSENGSRIVKLDAKDQLLNKTKGGKLKPEKYRDD